MKWRNLSWIATLYVGQSLPYALITAVTTIFYKNFQISNSKIALFTSLLYLPWSLKPLWAPALEMQYTKKAWLVGMQMLEAITLLLICAVLTLPNYFYPSIILFVMLSFFSASYDAVCDGYYMLNLSVDEQFFFVGARTLFYQLARLLVQGLFVIAAGYIAHHYSLVFAWQTLFFALGLTILLLSIWHKITLKETENTQTLANIRHTIANSKNMFKLAFKSFFTMKHAMLVISFLFIFNAAEAQYLKIIPLFFLDQATHGGLGLTTAQVGLVYGTLGGAAMVIGVLLGGITVEKFGLPFSLRAFSILMALSSGSYYFLTKVNSPSIIIITTLIILAQFCYGLSNSAYMSFILKTVLPLSYRTTCYALGTAVMSLSYLCFGAISGYIQYLVGYQNIFILLFGLGIAICLYAYLITRNMEV